MCRRCGGTGSSTRTKLSSVHMAKWIDRCYAMPRFQTELTHVSHCMIKKDTDSSKPSMSGRSMLSPALPQQPITSALLQHDSAPAATGIGLTARRLSTSGSVSSAQAYTAADQHHRTLLRLTCTLHAVVPLSNPSTLVSISHLLSLTLHYVLATPLPHSVQCHSLRTHHLPST